MKIVILIHQIIQEKFAYGDFFYVGSDRIHIHVKNGEKNANSGLEIVAGLTLPLK